MSWPGQLLFLLCAILAIGGAVTTVLARSPLRAAMALLVHILALAGLFVTLQAHLLAAIQLLVYAGAVVVLFIFVIMLIGPSASETTPSPGHKIRAAGARAASLALMAGLTLVLAFSLVKTDLPRASVPVDAQEIACVPQGQACPASMAGCSLECQATPDKCDTCILKCDSAECFQYGGVKAIGMVLYRRAVVPFELVGILLLVAIIGAVAIARGRTPSERAQSKEST